MQATAAARRATGGPLRPLLPFTVSFHDIDDAEGFVAATIRRALPEIPGASEEFDELKAEGLAILTDLAGRFEPHRPGYAKPGRFSGYAASFLPKRLGDAWHKMHPEHRYVTDPATGRRRWVYLMPPDSYERLQAGGTRPRDDTATRNNWGDGLLANSRGVRDMIPLPIPSRTCA